MGTCKYCGKDAGWFSRSHKECKEKNQKGMNDLSALINSYFALKVTAFDVQRTKNRLVVDAYLSEDDICNASEPLIRQYTASIHRPFSPSVVKLMDDFLNAIGISYSKINANGAVDEFTKKIIHGFMVEYFTDQINLQTAHTRCQKVLSMFPMSPVEVEDAFYYVLNKAATNFLKNGMLSNIEQQKIDDYVNLLSLPLNNLPVKYQQTDISKLGQMAILKNIQNGIMPSHSVSAPILLTKNESILWTYNGVNLYEEKITKEWVGRSSGYTVRIFKGLSYRTGQMRGRPVEHSSMEFRGTGALYITNKNLIFHSQEKGLKIPFNKIVGISPYADGIEVHRDGNNQKRITMQGFDPWFLMNALAHICNM